MLSLYYVAHECLLKIHFCVSRFLLSVKFIFLKIDSWKKLLSMFWKLFFVNAENNGKLRNGADGVVLQCRISWMTEKTRKVVCRY